MSVIISTDDLELTFPTCNGTGYIVVIDKKEPCSGCNGKGVILTALGQT
ncbi:tryptophan RNA-binding attenuation protein [Bacillus sp. ATD]